MVDTQPKTSGETRDFEEVERSYLKPDFNDLLHVYIEIWF